MQSPQRIETVNGPLFDQSTFLGRLFQQLYTCGPLSWSALFSTRLDRDHARRVLEAEAPSAFTASEIWEAKWLVATSVHPDTHELIPLPLRMAAHVPANTCLLVAMLSATSLPGQMLAQVANQSFNAAQFYANKNKSQGDIPSGTLAVSFGAAVATSLSTVWACDRWLRRREAAAALNSATGSSARLRALRLVVPFVAAAASKPLQIALMRWDEVVEGISVSKRVAPSRNPTAPSGLEVVGQSQVAGAAAVGMTIASRVLYLAQPMLLPPFVHAAMRRSRTLSRRPRLVAGLNVAFIASMSAVATPVCIAMFAQESALPASRLERRFHALGDTPLYFNKGL